MIFVWSIVLASASFVLGYLVGVAERESIDAIGPTEHGGNPL